jgi:PhzF family phenazine biosynthesis protein
VTELKLIQVDAFADRPFTGNPAAVMPLDAWLPDETLQAIALENNLSETAFTIPDTTGEADYELRWFTPAVEVVLCGHATFASGHVLIGDRDKVRFRTRKAGLLEVARGAASGRYEMSLPAWRPDPRPLPRVVAALGCEAIETLWHPQGYALIIVADEDVIHALRPDFRALSAEGDVLTIVAARGRETDVVSRVFAPAAGIDEDPVTGSAHAVMVPHWSGKLGRETLTYFQASNRGGHLTGRLAGDRAMLEGSCVTVLEGTMRL